MKATDRSILVAVGGVALIAVFWFLVLSPQREQAAELAEQNEALETQIAEQEQTAAYGEQARDDYEQNFRRVVTLGRAVPESSDSGSLFVQMSDMASTSEIDFMALELSSAGEAAPAPAAPPPTEPLPEEGEEDAEEPGEDGEGTGGGLTEVPVDLAAPATEAAAASLPIGATVGPAGLPVMPYELRLFGDFFGLADFLGRMDSMVSVRPGGSVRVSGRLATVDGFVFGPRGSTPLPALQANLAITTYVTPSDQGLLAGASAGAPGAPTDVSEVTP